jgi:hypothetical protein
MARSPARGLFEHVNPLGAGDSALIALRHSYARCAQRARVKFD